MHRLYVALCACHPKSGLLCHHTYCPALCSSTSHHPPSPPLTTKRLSVTMGLACFVPSFVAFCCVSPMQVKSRGSRAHCLTDCARHDTLKSHPCCRTWQCFIFSRGWGVLLVLVRKGSFLPTNANCATCIISRSTPALRGGYMDGPRFTKMKEVKSLPAGLTN